MKTLFKGGTIYDGTGGKPFVGDVLIEDDRIVKVAKNIRAKADKTVPPGIYVQELALLKAAAAAKKLETP